MQSTPHHKDSSFPKAWRTNAASGLLSTGKPRYLNRMMVSFKLPKYGPHERCTEKAGLWRTHSPQKWGSPAPSKNLPQQRQKEGVLRGFNPRRQERQITLSSGCSSKREHNSHWEGKKMSSASFKQEVSFFWRGSFKQTLPQLFVGSRYNTVPRVQHPVSFC